MKKIDATVTSIKDDSYHLRLIEGLRMLPRNIIGYDDIR